MSEIETYRVYYHDELLDVEDFVTVRASSESEAIEKFESKFDYEVVDVEEGYYLDTEEIARFAELVD